MLQQGFKQLKQYFTNQQCSLPAHRPRYSLMLPAWTQQAPERSRARRWACQLERSHSHRLLQRQPHCWWGGGGANHQQQAVVAVQTIQFTVQFQVWHETAKYPTQKHMTHKKYQTSLSSLILSATRTVCPHIVSLLPPQVSGRAVLVERRCSPSAFRWALDLKTVPIGIPIVMWASSSNEKQSKVHQNSRARMNAKADSETKYGSHFFLFGLMSLQHPCPASPQALKHNRKYIIKLETILGDVVRSYQVCHGFPTTKPDTFAGT